LVILIILVVIVLVFFLCRWYSNRKRNQQARPLLEKDSAKSADIEIVKSDFR